MNIFVPDRLGVGVRIRSTGSYLPARVVTNADVVARGGPYAEAEIVRLTGVRERRHAGPDEATSDLAVAAARVALERGNRSAAQIDRLVLATTSADHPVPAAACTVQRMLGMRQVAAYDLAAACSGFLYALDAAARAVATGEALVLAIAAEIRSRYVDPTDRPTAALFGDGAGAAVVEPCAPGTGVLAIGLSADGSGDRSVYIPVGGSRMRPTPERLADRAHYLSMQDGPQVYFSAVQGMIASGEALLSAVGLGWSDLAMVVPHQPNGRLLDRLARLAKIAPERLFVNVDRYGNTSGAACAIALDEALASGRLRVDDRVLLLTAGAGYTAAAALLVIDAALLATAVR